MIAVSILPAIVLSLMSDIMLIFVCCVALRFPFVRIAALLILISAAFDLLSGIELVGGEIQSVFGIAVPAIITSSPSTATWGLFDSIGEFLYMLGIILLLSVTIRRRMSRGKSAGPQQAASAETHA
jgi:hypothetical protein